MRNIPVLKWFTLQLGRQAYQPVFRQLIIGFNMLNDSAKLSTSQPYPLSISILCGIFTGCFTALQTSYISDIIVDYTLLSKPSCPNFCKYRHHSPTCSSRHLGVLPDFCLLFAISASNPSASAKQITFRTFHFSGPHSHRATVTLCPDPCKNFPTAGLTSLLASSSPLPDCSQEQCVTGINPITVPPFSQPH